LADADTNDPALEDAKRRKVLHALLDLIALEGIYPALSSGVGVPLEKRVVSALPPGIVAQQTSFTDEEVSKFSAILKITVDAVLEIIFDCHVGIQLIVRRRILSDIISGLAELAFQNHGLQETDKISYTKAFEKVLDEYGHILYAFLLPTKLTLCQDAYHGFIAYFIVLITTRGSPVVPQDYIKPHVSRSVA
jgi:hypothetical protein